MVTIGKMHVEDLGKQGESSRLKVYFPVRDDDGFEYLHGIILKFKPEDLFTMNKGSDFITYQIRPGGK